MYWTTISSVLCKHSLAVVFWNTKQNLTNYESPQAHFYLYEILPTQHIEETIVATQDKVGGVSVMTDTAILRYLVV